MLYRCFLNIQGSTLNIPGLQASFFSLVDIQRGWAGIQSEW